jgi:flagellar protein FlaG
MVNTMSANEMTVRSAMPPAVSRPVPSAPAAEPSAAPAKVEMPKEPMITAQELGQQAASTKGESVSQLNEMSERLRDAIETLNAAVKNSPTALSFSRDESSKRFVVQVTDTNTGEVVRNLPGDAVLRMSRQLDSLKGVIFDELF